MNVYHRLLNILAETTQPEYWTIDELLHYIDLSQRQLAKDSRINATTEKLLPLFTKNDMASNLPVTITTIHKRGLYKVPDDCMDIIGVYWKGKPLDKQNIDNINASLVGTSHFSGLKGEGKHYKAPLKFIGGSPYAWAYDEGIRIVPIPFDITDYWFMSFSELDLTDIDDEEEEIEFTNQDLADSFGDLIISCIKKVDSKTQVFVQFAKLIKETDNDKYYEDGQWELLKYRKDYFVSSKMPGNTDIILSNELIKKIRCKYKSCKIMPNFLFVNPSLFAEIKYIPVPEIYWDIRTLNDSGVWLELAETHHEAIACHAAFLALSKEGKKTQDIEKAQIYLTRYNSHVNGLKDMTKGSVNVDYRVLMPFRM